MRNKIFKNKKNSIALKLAKVMFVLIIFQSAALMGIIYATGVISSLQNSAYDSFSSKIANRKNYLENELNLRFSNITSYVSKANEAYNNIVRREGSFKEDYINTYFEVILPDIITMLRSTMGTGAFIILNNEDLSDTTHPTLYFKDSDPALSDDTNKDLSMLKGPVEIARSLQVPLDNLWTYELELTTAIKDIFYKPFNVAEKTSNIKLLGYWGVSPSLSSVNSRMLTYSVPLMDENGKAYGVLGVELAEEHLYKMLPAEELSSSGSLGYIIAYDEKGSVYPAITNGNMQKNIAPVGYPMSLDPVNALNEVSKISSAHTDFPVVAHFDALQLYNNNTPFNNTQWLLGGMNSERGLLEFTNGIIFTLIIAVIISVLIAMSVVLFIGFHFAKPIVNLANKVKNNNPANLLSLEKIGILEIDNLSSEIVTLNQNVFEIASKTDNIIKMTGLPLGTFEYNKNTDFVVCSDVLLDMFGLTVEDNNKAVDKQVFFNKLGNIKSNVEDSANNIYKYGSPSVKYLRIVTIETKNTLLGAVLDATTEVLENHTIKFERDYDTLTGLFNRFAFQREISNLWQKGIKGVSGFLMLDLDNLKYINDTYGHDSGDIYIKESAHAIYKFLHHKGIVGRMSGDEFYVFLHGFDSQDEVRDLIRKMYESFDFNLLILPNGTHFKIRMSGGISWYEQDSKNIQELTRFADFAMYKGKHSIKGELREFERSVYESESFMLSGKEELNNILDNQLVEYAYQPIICAKTGDIYAYESLMRPVSEVLSSPIKLIQIAEAQSKLWQIEKITFFKSLSGYARFKELFKDKKIFINSVPNQILKEWEYAEIEKLYPDILSNVVIEITESEKLDVNTLVYKKELVKRWGGELALDDYGSGYNGDLSLLNISPKIVKIDRFMIGGIELDTSRQSIIQKLLLYAKEHDILVVAEGVETKIQFEYLVRMGVDLLQGYYIGYPSFTPDFDNTKIKEEIKEIQRD